MKIIGARFPLPAKNQKFPSPIKLSPITKSIPSKKVSSIKILINFFFVSIFIVIFLRVFPSISPPSGHLIKSYSLIPFVYIFTIFLGLNVQVISLLFKDVPINIHNSPLKSKSLFEFWSLRWNVWIRDWLRSLGMRLFPKKPIFRQFFIFLVSGIFHEFMLTIPFFVATGKNLIGTMVIYFLIQFFGLIIDKQLKRFRIKMVRLLFMWAVLILPSPLFINEAFIQLFGL
jgi:hypothetical protein